MTDFRRPLISTIPIDSKGILTWDQCHWLSYEIILPCIGRMSKMDPICNLGVYFCANYWWSPRWTRTWYGLSLQIGLDAHDSLLRWSLRRRKSLDILRVKKRVPALILAWVNLWEVLLWKGSNHCWIILEKWLDAIKWNHVWKWFKSHARGAFAQRNEIKIVATLKCCGLQEMSYEDIEDSSGRCRRSLLAKFDHQKRYKKRRTSITYTHMLFILSHFHM